MKTKLDGKNIAMVIHNDDTKHYNHKIEKRQNRGIGGQIYMVKLIIMISKVVNKIQTLNYEVMV